MVSLATLSGPCRGPHLTVAHPIWGTVARGAADGNDRLRGKSDGQGGRFRLRDRHDTFIAHGPADGWRQAFDVLAAQIEQVAIAFGDEFTDRDLTPGVSEGNGGYGLGVTSHLRAGSHRAEA